MLSDFSPGISCAAMSISLCNIFCEREWTPSPFGGKFVEYVKWVGDEGSFEETNAPLHVKDEPASLQPQLHCRFSPQCCRPIPGLQLMGWTHFVGLDSISEPRFESNNLGPASSGRGTSSTPTLFSMLPPSKLASVRKRHWTGVRPIPGTPTGIQDRLGGEGLKNWAGQDWTRLMLEIEACGATLSLGPPLLGFCLYKGCPCQWG